ncbi:carboxylating nicotinate-nucleotide diphosphorylase [Phaeodactylibacter sp.]|uniref:carboxylating nicotinate-nucleotide diphosphorylase n=1 Tax=Phaeodactylibacter sp. TaxID=1940289 RepID=UPI0025E56D67|nr:carboxylating nicotinate-nucleotide diphosphorylase [Phaeodactylibacter sp.]MCI4651631.1 carboxylating nicotinate-nucleotide diphosphorylase [Phaeodactylibacter sp.]MCI5090756.1 carboxylating nicotinate-nucleotide diphosphorylase [Phaeodactylibacter sp.]
MSTNMAELQDYLEFFVTQALKEDVGDGDHTSLACIPADARSKARLYVKDPGVIAGMDVAAYIFRHVDPSSTFTPKVKDGQPVSYGDVAFEVECNAQALLRAERLVLNTMQRMTGIATLSNRFKFEVEDLNVTILDTRKTTPLIRPLEKLAVKLGGCDNYRFGLFDWIMIKDNHIDACGSITAAIERVAAYQKEKGTDLGVTVEVRNLVELHEVLQVGQVTRILLDNFELPLMEEAVHTVNKRFETEASGGVNIHNVREVALTGVDYVSVGALTHSAQSLDLSLKVVKEVVA